MINFQHPTLLALSQSGPNALFFSVIALIGAALTAAVIFGITRWKRPLGKVAAIGAGVLLLALAAFVIVLLVLIWSLDHGSPM
jgi:hypothetical protein